MTSLLVASVVPTNKMDKIDKEGHNVNSKMCLLHLGKSGTIRESNQASGVRMAHFT